MKILGIIPARYGSTRFPAKALADIGGITMVRRVYEQAKKSKLLTKVIVATDHADIYNEIDRFGGHVVMTRESHQSGTDRCYEALKKQNEAYDYVINIQGDEPFIDPAQIDLAGSLLDGSTQLATLIKKIENTDDLFNPNMVKVIYNQQREAIYFSRTALPYDRVHQRGQWLEKRDYYRHIGIYAYRSDILEIVTALQVSELEKSEALEQLRWIENGFKIKVAETYHDSIGVDTPEDLQKLKNFY